MIPSRWPTWVAPWMTVLLLAVASTGCGSKPETEPETRVEEMARPLRQQVRDLFDQGQHDKALDLAQEVLVTSPHDVVALRTVANVYAQKGRFNEAAEIAVTLSNANVPDPVRELLQAMEWHLRGGDIRAAEGDVRRAITIAPNDTRGQRVLAQLLNAQGRRFEAQQHVISLARSGAITPRELLSLIDQSSPFQLVSFDPIVGESSDKMFALGKARHQYIDKGKPHEALTTVNELIVTRLESPAAEAFRGRLVAETQGSEQFRLWTRQLPSGIDGHPEYWLAIGTWLNRNDRDKEAVRALGEALRLDPTDRRALRLLTTSLSRLGENEKSRHSQETLAVLDKIFRLASTADAKQAMWIAEQLQTLTRPWESIAWYRYAFALQDAIESHASELNNRARQIHEWENAASADQIRDVRLTRMLGFDIREFPLPELEASILPQTVVVSDVERSSLNFRDVADEVGIKTSFVSEYPLETVDFYLYQANGGGLAALDYDLDGLSDLYVVQTGGDPNKKGSSVANQLFRQLPGGRFEEVSIPSLTADRGYGQGVCAGDVNQDGLPDLLIANIGSNSLYINQGDGTYRERSDLIFQNSARWTSSLALGDLDGDHLPELVEINYLDDPLIFERKCKGRVLNCTPQRFKAASDRIFRGCDDGTFRLWDGAENMEWLPNYGFGSVIADFDGQNGNDMFVANDGDLNHFWKSVPMESGGADSNAAPRTERRGHYGMTESAGIGGCSIGTSGISQACMGIASGDFDRNGRLDLFVTNFHNEPVNLFLQNASDFFVDEALNYELVEPSRDVLGFGTQSADFDNDGWLDLAVLNGHIYDASYADIPFRMVSQLFRGSRGEFSLQDAKTAGTYWNRPQLARTLALWDFNRDGRMDLVASHLDQPIAILKNHSDENNWLQLELVGVTSEREAIGAHVVIHAGGQQWSGWQTGGDGYMCTNEPLIHFGIGTANMVKKVDIRWPSGTTQTISSLTPNARYLVVEGESPVARAP